MDWFKIEHKHAIPIYVIHRGEAWEFIVKILWI